MRLTGLSGNGIPEGAGSLVGGCVESKLCHFGYICIEIVRCCLKFFVLMPCSRGEPIYIYFCGLSRMPLCDDAITHEGVSNINATSSA